MYAGRKIDIKCYCCKTNSVIAKVSFKSTRKRSFFSLFFSKEKRLLGKYVCSTLLRIAVCIRYIRKDTMKI